MGGNLSKSSPETAAPMQKNDLDKDVGNNSDPRSPTPEITRTPLQNKNGGKHNITKNVDLRKTFESGKAEEKLIHNNPILSAVIKNHLQSYDPRSPTQDFDRTPIIINSKIDQEIDKKQLRIHADNNNFGSPCLKNETLDSNNFDSSFDVNEVSPDLVVPKNLCEGFYDITLNDTLKESEEPLGSSTASNEVIDNDMSKDCEKPSKLLETNFEYIETDVDKFEDSEEHIGAHTEDPEKMDYEIKNIPLFKILHDDPRSPSTGIDRTPIVVSKAEVDVSEGNVEEMSDDSLLKALQTTNSENLQNKDNNQNDDADGILIYEDKSNTLDTPKKSKSTNNSGSRTPLSCMKNKSESHGRSKSANTYDPNNQKAIKLQKRVSHIPRLKSLQSKYICSENSISMKNITITNATSGDCENTPPHSHRDRWDKDSSIVL